MNGGIWAQRVRNTTTASVTYTAVVEWRIVDNAPIAVPALIGWVDDWTLKVDQYN
jgi:hypothetical protein